MEPILRFTGALWEAQAADAWVFVTVPPDDAELIRELAPTRRGFGSVRVRVALGATRWATSVFPDTKVGSYVLPVKRAVREAEGVDVGDEVEIELTVVLE